MGDLMWGQRTSYSASFRHRFCNISFVAKPSYIYDRNQNTIEVQGPNCLKKKKKKSQQVTYVFKVV
jgi:hypothetical protein